MTSHNSWVPYGQLAGTGILHNTADIVDSTLSDSLTYHEKTYQIAAY